MSKRNNIFFSSLVTIFIFTAFQLTIAVGQDLVIATVDINEVLNASKDAQSLKKNLDSKAGDLRKKIEKQRDDLQKKEKGLKEKGSKASDEEIAKFQSEARDFSRFVKDSEEDLQRQFRKANDQLTREALQAVEKYAKANSIDLVLEKSEAARGVVLYRAPSADITGEVVKMMR